MPSIPSNYDGANLFYRDYVPQDSAASFHRGQDSEYDSKPSLVFSTAWPFSAHMYDHLVLQLCETHRYRCILPDRRGFGKSEWTGASASQHRSIDYAVFGRDLRQIVESSQADKGHGFIAVGTSMGCGEILQMLADDKHGELKAACKGIVYMCSSLPIPMQTEKKPAGPPREFWDDLLTRMREDAGTALAGTLPVIFGSKLESMSTYEKRRYEIMLEEVDVVAAERTVQIYLDRDFTDTIETFGKDFKSPILILHGTEDRANPVEVSPNLVNSLLPTSEVKVYDDAGHGLYQTHKARCLEDLLAFMTQVS